MPNFEDIGRRIDREVKRMLDVLEHDVQPATERKLIAGLRKASERLADAAARLEARAAKRAQ